MAILVDTGAVELALRAGPASTPPLLDASREEFRAVVGVVFPLSGVQRNGIRPGPWKRDGTNARQRNGRRRSVQVEMRDAVGRRVGVCAQSAA